MTNRIDLEIITDCFVLDVIFQIDIPSLSPFDEGKQLILIIAFVLFLLFNVHSETQIVDYRSIPPASPDSKLNHCFRFSSTCRFNRRNT